MKKNNIKKMTEDIISYIIVAIIIALGILLYNYTMLTFILDSNANNFAIGVWMFIAEVFACGGLMQVEPYMIESNEEVK